jgi:hypothetical protein
LNQAVVPVSARPRLGRSGLSNCRRDASLAEMSSLA